MCLYTALTVATYIHNTWSQFMSLFVSLMVATYMIRMTKNYIMSEKKALLWVDILMLAALPITYMVPKAK